MTVYIGVTGFMKRDDVEAVLAVFPKNPTRKLMVGVLASSKTIKGGQSKWPKRYPSPEQLGNIFVNDPRALNLIHFNTKDPELLYDQMLETRELAGPFCEGFQLNIAWPDPSVLERIHLRGQYTKIVLQIGARAFEAIGNNPQRLADKVTQEYGPLVDYVLLDSSGGLGKELDPNILREYLYALSEKQLECGLGIAGGLSPTTLHLIEPLAQEFRGLSIDAESKLRNKDDDLDLSVAIPFVNNALSFFDTK